MKKSPAARDLNDLFRDGDLDLDSVSDVQAPRLPLADAEDLWLAEIARRPEYLDVTKVTARHLSAHAKLLLAAIQGLHAAKLPVDRKSLDGDIASRAALAVWATWDRKGDMPALDPRSLPRRMHVKGDGNLSYAEDCLVRSFAESKYTEALGRAQRLSVEHGVGPAQELLRGVESRIEAATTGVKFKSVADVARGLRDELAAKLRDGDTSFISTGYGRLDAFTKGWRRRRMTAFGGHPGHGKSTIMLQILAAMAIGGRDVHLISLEDEAVITLTRIIMHKLTDHAAAKRLATLTPGAMYVGGYVQKDVDTLSYFIDDVIAKMRLTIVDDGPWSKEKVRTAILAAGRSGAEVVAVDYVQAIPKNGQDQTTVHNDAVNTWKDAGKAANVHLMVGTQLRRAPGRASDRDAAKVRPAVDDSAYCPAIEQAAEYVILCHRYEKDREALGQGERDKLERARLILAKAKDGPVGSIECSWDNERQQFVGL